MKYEIFFIPYHLCYSACPMISTFQCLTLLCVVVYATGHKKLGNFYTWVVPRSLKAADGHFCSEQSGQTMDPAPMSFV